MHHGTAAVGVVALDRRMAYSLAVGRWAMQATNDDIACWRRRADTGRAASVAARHSRVKLVHQAMALRYIARAEPVPAAKIAFARV